MELTGKCKEAFEKWYADNVEFTGEVLYLEEFYILPPSMKYGVYVDFFDSVGYEILMDRISQPTQLDTNYRAWVNRIAVDGSGYRGKFFPYTRPKARTAAIEKANELFNT